MISRILAAVAATACTAAIVGSIPASAPIVAARPPQAVQLQTTRISGSDYVVAAAVAVPGIRENVCTQDWPYYEQSCLHDSRRSDGKERVVRVVAVDRSVAGRGSQLRR